MSCLGPRLQEFSLSKQTKQELTQRHEDLSSRFEKFTEKVEQKLDQLEREVLDLRDSQKQHVISLEDISQRVFALASESATMKECDVRRMDGSSVHQASAREVLPETHADVEVIMSLVKGANESLQEQQGKRFAELETQVHALKGSAANEEQERRLVDLESKVHALSESAAEEESLGVCKYVSDDAFQEHVSDIQDKLAQVLELIAQEKHSSMTPREDSLKSQDDSTRLQAHAPVASSNEDVADVDDRVVEVKSESAPQSKPKSLIRKIYDASDFFKTDDDQRDATPIGIVVSGCLLLPLCLAYAVHWIINYVNSPPTEASETIWSMAHGPYPLEIECVAGAQCWLWLTDCVPIPSAPINSDVNICIAMQPNERRTIQMCYGDNPRKGLQMRWSGPQHAIRIWSYANDEGPKSKDGVWPMDMYVEPGLSYLTYVKTENRTRPEGHPGRERHEWFPQWVSLALLNDTAAGPCSSTTFPANSYSARVLMQSDFYSIESYKLSPWSEFVGDFGGAYGLLTASLFWVYLPLYSFFHRRSAMCGI